MADELGPTLDRDMEQTCYGLFVVLGGMSLCSASKHVVYQLCTRKDGVQVLPCAAEQTIRNR